MNYPSSPFVLISASDKSHGVVEPGNTDGNEITDSDSGSDPKIESNAANPTEHCQYETEQQVQRLCYLLFALDDAKFSSFHVRVI